MSLKFRGVSAHKDGGYVAHIGLHGKHHYLGWFRSFDEAKSARLKAEVDMTGSTFDRREIELCGDHAKIPLHGQRGVFYDWALVDIADLDKVKEIAWTKDPRGYVAGRPAGFSGSVTIHRWIMLNGIKGGSVVDHINGNRLDNRRVNLRLCSAAENARNTRRGKNNSSGAKGVTQTPAGKWRARIWMDRKEIHIGTYSTKAAAQLAYDRAAAELHGNFASPNASGATL